MTAPKRVTGECDCCSRVVSGTTTVSSGHRPRRVPDLLRGGSVRAWLVKDDRSGVHDVPVDRATVERGDA